MSEINYQELRVELGAAKKRIEELEANRVVLEVENERLKHAMAVALSIYPSQMQDRQVSLQ